MLVYDISNAKSFENISKWLRNIDEVRLWSATRFEQLRLQRDKIYVPKSAISALSLPLSEVDVSRHRQHSQHTCWPLLFNTCSITPPRNGAMIRIQYGRFITAMCLSGVTGIFPSRDYIRTGSRDVWSSNAAPRAPSSGWTVRCFGQDLHSYWTTLWLVIGLFRARTTLLLVSDISGCSDWLLWPFPSRDVDR